MFPPAAGWRLPTASARLRGRRPSRPRRSRTGHSDPCAVGYALEVAAPAPARQHLARVRDAVGIERVAQPCLRVEVVRREDERHQVALLDADAVLTREY